MGGIISAFSAIIQFFTWILQIAQTAGELFPIFLANPLLCLMKLLLLILGSIIGFFIWMQYLLLSLIIEPAAYIIGLWLALWWGVATTIYAAALWAVHGLVTLVIYVADFFTGGAVFQLMICESNLESWATQANYAAGNQCSRNGGLGCVRPCGNRYTPGFGGLICTRNPTYLPSLCPQQHVYRAYVDATDPTYATAVNLSTVSNPAIVDKIDPDPTFKLLSAAGKKNYLIRAYGNKTKFLTQCYEGMSPYDALTRNLCANAKLLLTDGPLRDTIMQACNQVYCQYKYTPKGLKPSTVNLRGSGEGESFCSEYLGSLDSGPDTTEDPNVVIGRILFWLVTAIVLYMIVLTVQRVATVEDLVTQK